MVLSLNEVEDRINLMDCKYDANFGDWIRNEENSRIIGYHLKKYIDDYPVSDFIVVLKWIVKDWTLRSIILLCQKMIISDIENFNEKEININEYIFLNNSNQSLEINNQNKSKINLEKNTYINIKQIKNRMEIIKGLIYTWNPIFIAEFIGCILNDFSKENKILFLKFLIQEFESDKLNDILDRLAISSDIDDINKLKLYNKKKRKPKNLIEAYNVI